MAPSNKPRAPVPLPGIFLLSLPITECLPFSPNLPFPICAHPPSRREILRQEEELLPAYGELLQAAAASASVLWASTEAAEVTPVDCSLVSPAVLLFVVLISDVVIFSFLLISHLFRVSLLRFLNSEIRVRAEAWWWGRRGFVSLLPPYIQFTHPLFVNSVHSINPSRCVSYLTEYSCVQGLSFHTIFLVRCIQSIRVIYLSRSNR
jgi:hypothetical protein